MKTLYIGEIDDAEITKVEIVAGNTIKKHWKDISGKVTIKKDEVEFTLVFSPLQQMFTKGELTKVIVTVADGVAYANRIAKETSANLAYGKDKPKWT